MNQTFTITTPLYYVNDLPHIGSAYTTMVADAVSRFQKLTQKEVLFITGTDEHGQKIERTAKNKNLSPQIHCDQIAGGFQQLWSKLNIKYDRFSRTTDQRHHAIVQEFFHRVWEKGDIYQGQQQGWYCVACEEYKDERELLEDRHCPLHPNLQVEWKDEQNYFFKLSKYQDQILKLYADNVDFIQPKSRRNEVINFVNQGLQDFSISRVNVDWGFPLPIDPNHTIYVWFDALLGYVTALLDPNEEPTLNNALKKWWPINLHLIGKDILRFHAVYWPAMLMSAELPLPDRVFGHGFLTKNGRKISKSVGNTIDPFDLVDRYGAESIRYYFLKEIELGQDGDFNEQRFIDVVNNDLADGLGNLLNRTLNMAKKYCQNQIPAIQVIDFSEQHPLKSIGLELGDRVYQSYQNLAFTQGIEDVFTLIRASNKYIDDQAPWSLFKQGKQTEVEELIYSVLESVRLAAFLLSPIIPQISTEIYQQLGFTLDLDNLTITEQFNFISHSKWGVIPPTQKLGTPKPIFTKLASLAIAT